jgi:hypothetical protein
VKEWEFAGRKRLKQSPARFRLSCFFQHLVSKNEEAKQKNCEDNHGLKQVKR